VQLALLLLLVSHVTPLQLQLQVVETREIIVKITLALWERSETTVLLETLVQSVNSVTIVQLEAMTADQSGLQVVQENHSLAEMLVPVETLLVQVQIQDHLVESGLQKDQLVMTEHLVESGLQNVLQETIVHLVESGLLKDLSAMTVLHVVMTELLAESGQIQDQLVMTEHLVESGQQNVQ
jgi:hypothetical protein